MEISWQNISGASQENGIAAFCRWWGFRRCLFQPSWDVVWTCFFVCLFVFWCLEESCDVFLWSSRIKKKVLKGSNWKFTEFSMQVNCSFNCVSLWIPSGLHDSICSWPPHWVLLLSKLVLVTTNQFYSASLNYIAMSLLLGPHKL